MDIHCRDEGKSVQPLGRKIVVAAFDGWNDAGEAATSALDLLQQRGEYEAIYSADPELYFDYQYTRPRLENDGEGIRRLIWPTATLYRPREDTGGTQFWLLTGMEPSRAWQAFTSELLDTVLSEDISSFISLGSMMADVPHTRPISVYASTEDDVLQSQLQLERSLYEGPVGILSVLVESAQAVGIPSAALWASVPHYVAGHTPSPKATLALIDKLADLTGVEIPRGALPTDADTWEASIDAAAAEDEDMIEYIRQLEQARDTWDSPDASGDAIAREFEHYLRRDDGRGRGRGEEPRR